MTKELRKKPCAFCNEEFEYSSIRAKYCSDNCRNNANRRKNNRKLYGRNYPIHVELTQEQYEYLLDKLEDEYDMKPTEFIHWLLTERMLSSFNLVFLKDQEKDLLKHLFKEKGYSDNFGIALRNWIIKTSEEQLSKLPQAGKK
jgi:hypothetical protein